MAIAPMMTYRYCDDVIVTEHDVGDAGRAPICPSCGVTALPADTSNVIDTSFICENPDCEAFGERVPN